MTTTERPNDQVTVDWREMCNQLREDLDYAISVLKLIAEMSCIAGEEAIDQAKDEAREALGVLTGEPK